MKTSGYYRFPTIFKDKVVFVSEDDLWQVPAEGGRAIRLTSNLGEVSNPRFSPDGEWLAFTSYRTGNNDIFILHLDSQNIYQLSVSAKSDWQPRWGN